MQVNQEQRLALLPKIKAYFKNELEGKSIAFWGLSFKPDTDDIREAPALFLLKELLPLGVKVKAYDPEAMENVALEMGDSIDYCQNPYETLERADALVICTEWSVFRSPDFGKIRSLMKTPAVFDGRNIFEPEEMKTLGFDYFSIGR
jgi:UDPglucose 6-dehydrogenase